MNQIQHSISYKNERSDSDGSSGGRNIGRRVRAAVAQELAENREGLGMSVIAVMMVQRYGVLPKELWDLNSISDMGAGRGVTYDGNLSRDMFESIVSNSRFSIANITIQHNNHKVLFPPSLRRLNIREKKYRYALDPLPANLQELTFMEDSMYNRPLVLPKKLLKLVVGKYYSQPLTLPPELLELELGLQYEQPLLLPQHLERLIFPLDGHYRIPIALPQSLLCIQLRDEYNQPIVLPSGIQEIRIGSDFIHNLLLPKSLRKIEWRCKQPIQIPEGVLEFNFGCTYGHAVTFPASLRKVSFSMYFYNHPVNLPSGLQELTWCVKDCDGLVLPEGLKKLTWGCSRPINLPLGLSELVITGNAPLELPEGLLKVTFECQEAPHYNLPESVQEAMQVYAVTFTHPTVLQHFILKYRGEVDLSSHRIYKITIDHREVTVRKWPQELKELAFSVDDMKYPLRVPKGCSIVGEKRPVNVIME